MVICVVGTKSTRTSGSPRSVRRIWSLSKMVQQQKTQAQLQAQQQEIERQRQETERLKQQSETE